MAEVFRIKGIKRESKRRIKSLEKLMAECGLDKVPRAKKFDGGTVFVEYALSKREFTGEEGVIGHSWDGAVDHPIVCEHRRRLLLNNPYDLVIEVLGDEQNPKFRKVYRALMFFDANATLTNLRRDSEERNALTVYLFKK